MAQYVEKPAMVASIQEAYCSYEVSKLLKKKGFDWECTSHFDEEGKVFPYTRINFNVTKYWISRPTHQMAMAWLREKYDLHIIAYPYNANGKKKWCCQVYKAFNLLGHEKYVNETLDSHEEAVEAALKYSLKNLL